MQLSGNLRLNEEDQHDQDFTSEITDLKMKSLILIFGWYEVCEKAHLNALLKSIQNK